MNPPAELKKERANKLFVKFKSPLPSQSLTSLASNSTFTGRFSAVNVIKQNESVIGIQTIDKDNIEYALNIEGIEAFSRYQKDSLVKTKLERFTKGVLTRLGRSIDEYELDDTTRHKIIKFDLKKLLDSKIISKLNEIFKDKGYDEPIIISVKMLAKKKGEIKKSILFHYPESKSEKEKKAVIEANTDLINGIVGELK